MMAYLLAWWNGTGTAASASAEPVRRPAPSNNQQVDCHHEYARIPVDLELIPAPHICSQAEAMAI